MAASSVAPAGMVTVTRGPSGEPQAARVSDSKTRNAEVGTRNRASNVVRLFRVPRSDFRVLTSPPPPGIEVGLQQQRPGQGVHGLPAPPRRPAPLSHGAPR